MATAKNFQATTPPAPAAARNATWQVATSPSGNDPTTGQPVYPASCYTPDMVGDAGTGGADGLVPAPGAGSAAAGKFLKADGTWAVPPVATPGGTSGQIEYNNSGAFGGFTVGGDGTLVPSTGVLTVTKTSGVAFAPSATIDTTDASNIASGTLATALLTTAVQTGAIGITIDGGGSLPTTGLKGLVQIPYGCTIAGWTIIADQFGSASVDVWFLAGSAPPATPSIPTSSNKISASAPAALSSAQAASGGSSAISTWTKTISQWGTVGFNLTSVTACTRLTLELQVTKA
jgi:hypothetical protein